MIILKDLKEILEVIVLTANVFGLFIKFQSWFFDYKFDQRMRQMGFDLTNKNRCFSRKDKQR